MNNGKVRIYELSKELDLDNKDLLSICEGLNISVKSHSSTISEIEAERIRAAAEKHSARSAATKRVNTGERTERRATASPAVKLTGRPNVEHKQQILQIKHKIGSGSSSKDSGANVAIPPQPPVKPQIASPMKPTIVNRPVRQSESEPEAMPETELHEETFQEPTTAPESLPSAPAKPPVSIEPKASFEPRPQLVEPPARPNAVEPPKSSPIQAPIVDRPVLKKAKVEQSSVASPVVSPVAAPKNQPPTKSVGNRRPAPAAEPSEPAAQPVPELQRPQRKVKPPARELPRPGIAPRSGEGPRMPNRSALATETKDKDNDDSSIETLELDLKRPTPPRLVKKTKTWEEDTEEDSEISSKANKLGAKGKRRSALILDDDDEDLAAALEGLDSPVLVNLSVARPPKQKTGTGVTPAPVAANLPTAARAKKPKSDRDGQKSESRDRRRDQKVVAERPTKITLSGSMTVRELAAELGVPETEIIKKLFFKGMVVNITQTLDIPTCSMVAEELGVEIETVEEQAPATKVTEMLDANDLENLEPRPPVVTIMGHVDHGKTTLLDAIRETKVAQGEAGGITQHIGAYHVDVEHEGKTQQVVFLDTPGHEAFTAMRARGARVTDIAILVVAADDGVRPQTIEAIKHAQAAEVPIVVAINKIDKPEAQPERVKQELTEYGLLSEEWGGQTIMVEVSALKGENLDRLLEMILLSAEIEELSANPNRAAKGTVIEAHLDKAKGPVATLLVQNGTLRVGDTLVAGHVFGKVRAMVDDRGARVEAASPSFAVEVLGLSDVPAAGDDFEVFPEKEARATAQDRADQQRQSRLQQVMASRRVTLNTLSAQAQEGELKELNLILKADVQGSVEAILGALRQLPQNEVQVRVLLTAAGEITETDVDLAAASGAVIIGFNTTLASGARSAADQAGVDVREYNIIYKLLDDIQAAMEGLLDPEQVEEALGQVEVRAVFPVGRGAVAGCYVLSGKAIRNCRVRVRRGSKVVYEGGLDSLKRMKDDAKEVNAGYECGIRIDNFNDWAEGDIIETYQLVSKRRTLSPA